jgi:hypothetical protein
MYFICDLFCCVPVYGVPLNYESVKSLIRANTVNMSSPPLVFENKELRIFELTTDDVTREFLDCGILCYDGV